MLKKIIPVFIILCFSARQHLFSQETTFNGERHKWGFDLGYGDQTGLDVNYIYKIFFFQYQYYFTLTGGQKGSLEIIAQPQFNLTTFRQDMNSRSFTGGYEYGLNAGFLVRRNFRNGLLGAYLFISTGPHCISGAPDRQSPGFIFSDNFFSGLNIRLQGSLYLDLRLGFRHISNAGLKDPNGGVNSYVLCAGFFKSIQQRSSQH